MPPKQSKAEAEFEDFLTPSSRRTTGDLGQIVDFLEPQPQEVLSFDSSPHPTFKFDQFLEEFSPATASPKQVQSLTEQPENLNKLSE